MNKSACKQVENRIYIIHRTKYHNLYRSSNIILGQVLMKPKEPKKSANSTKSAQADLHFFSRSLRVSYDAFLMYLGFIFLLANYFTLFRVCRYRSISLTFLLLLNHFFFFFMVSSCFCLLYNIPAKKWYY